MHCISLHNFHINDNWQHCNTAWLNRNVKLFFILLHIRKRKSLENSQYFFVKTKTKTKTLLFVLEVPQDQDFGLEDYITNNNHAIILLDLC